MRFAFAGESASKDVVVGRVFFDNVWDVFGRNDFSGTRKKLYKLKVFFFVNLEVPSARACKLLYDDRRDDEFVILLGCVFSAVGTPVTRRPPHRPGRAVFPHPVPRLHSLPRRWEPSPAFHLFA
ncbi:MAG: hypothetical protein ACREYE_18985, partial [Gammaproteobacteria bacterium]